MKTKQNVTIALATLIIGARQGCRVQQYPGTTLCQKFMQVGRTRQMSTSTCELALAHVARGNGRSECISFDDQCLIQRGVS